MPDDIPFTTFDGQIKQLETNFKLPIMGQFFKPCFSAFDDLDLMYADMKRQGINYLVSAAGTMFNFGYRPRRFSGGPGLPPGRYFTICDGEDFNDRGTLRDEITAYYQGSSGLTPMIYDPKIETYLTDFLRESGGFTEEDSNYPFYLIVYQIERWTEKNAALRECEHPFEVGQRMSITYGVRQLSAHIEQVIDLRDPETQAWFTKTFVELELQNEAVHARETSISFPPKRPLESFDQLLPVIVSLETGGGMSFTQAIGHWLRRHGANGLIFPSARSNTFDMVRDSRPVAWGGWNLVVYTDAAEPVPINLFGGMTTWRDPDHDHIYVNYTADGAERGSFSIRGVREFNLLDFDLKKQVACGVRENNMIHDIMGIRNEAISREVNSLLEQERAAGREIWHKDADYVKFVEWYESQWRKDSGNET